MILQYICLFIPTSLHKPRGWHLKKLTFFLEHENFINNRISSIEFWCQIISVLTWFSLLALIILAERKVSYSSKSFYDRLVLKFSRTATGYIIAITRASFQNITLISEYKESYRTWRPLQSVCICSLGKMYICFVVGPIL